MRKAFSLAGLALIGLVVFAGTSTAQGIAGSAHDFSFTASLCEACHVPHNPAVTTGAVIPLQNHPNTTATSWTKYSSSTMDATVGNPSGVDLLCLGCHDGSVAIDAYGGAAGSTFIPAAFKVGAVTAGNGDLSNDHPVSFSYDASVLADSGIKARSVPEGVGIKFFGAGNDVKCASCHDPHNGPGNTFLLRASAVTICTQCHAK